MGAIKVRVALDEIEAVTHRALVKHGAKHWIAAEVARAVRKAEATGNIICGLYYLESYCTQLTSGRVKGDVEPVVSHPRPASVAVDAKLGFAQPAFARGLPEAVKAARAGGTSALAIQHAHTCTSLGYFAEQIAAEGLVGIGFTNASAIVAAPGGSRRILGTNPIAMAVPARAGGIAFQFDQSTSAVALGKITMAAAAGEAIPLGWAVDKDGQPTTDAKAALSGALVSTGGYKGWGFGLMAEVMAAAMTAGTPSLRVAGLKAPEGPPHDLGQFYLLLDPATFAGDAFFDRLEEIGAAVTSEPGSRLPGTERKDVAEVEIGAAIWAQSQRLAAG